MAHRLTALCSHLPEPGLVSQAVAETGDEYQATVDRQARGIVLPYLRAFDRWQRVANPRNPFEAAAEKEAVARAGGASGGGGVFAECRGALAALRRAAQLRPHIVTDVEESAGQFHGHWMEVLGNLGAIHARHVLGEEGAAKGGKESGMTHGVKYKLYEMRNVPILRSLRAYWHAGVGEAAEVPEAEWAAREQGELGPERTGVFHIDRDGWKWSLYVPESYREKGSYPLVLAMHGGGGRGDDYLLSWLAAARTHRCFVVSPKSLAQTWGLTSEEQSQQDTISLLMMLHQVTTSYTAVDKSRIFCTGMSDGGTFSYLLTKALAGLGAPIFAGVAPAAAFPMPTALPAEQLKLLDGTPVHHVHGTKDWMFPIEQVREADQKARAALGGWAFTELPDWTHASPTKVNQDVIWPWFAKLPPNRHFDGDFSAILKRLAPEMFKEKEEPMKRIASDGKAYTKEEFVSFFGGTDEWDKAAGAGAV